MKANKSLASEYGIQHKNISKNPSQGIGLNPNLNIEDEYIENLLKQVHFLNMQIKLIKEKQGQNKGLGIMGLLNKDQNPVVQHAITSNNKFSQMKNNLSQKVNSAQVEYLRLDDENFAVKAQRDFTERLSLKEQQNNIENKLYIDKQLTESIDNFKDQERKLQELRDQNNRVNKIHDKIERQWQELNFKDRTKQLLITIINNLQGETSQLNQKHFKANFESLQYHQKKLDEADALFRADDNYKQLVVQNGQLKDKLKRSDKELFDINYRVKEMQQMKKLSIRNKDVESELKKQAIDEVQRLKKRLTQKKNQFQNKFQEMKAGLDSNDDVRLLRGKLVRKDKEILDLRKKTQMSQNNYKRLRDDVLKLQTNLIEIKERNKQKQQHIPVISAILNEVEVQLREAELDFEKNQAQLRTNENNLIESKNRLENYEEQLAYLEAKQQFFKKEVDVDEGIKKVRIDQLTTLMHNNSGLNNTITDLMGKWQQIIKFTRQPPN